MIRSKWSLIKQKKGLDKRNLIQLHKEKVWFKSSTDEKDHGTTFYFSLPILKKKPFDPHEGEGALFQTGKPKPASAEEKPAADTKPKVVANAPTDKPTTAEKAEPKTEVKVAEEIPKAKVWWLYDIDKFEHV